MLVPRSPVFVKIGGFHVCSEEFYKSFKPKGLIDNEVMTLWTNQFNIEEAELRIKDNNVVKKYAFSAILTVVSFFVISLFEAPLFLYFSSLVFLTSFAFLPLLRIN
jgi:hypothetical protein